MGLDEFEAMWTTKADHHVLLRTESGELMPYNRVKKAGYMFPRNVHDAVVERMLQAGVPVVEPGSSATRFAGPS